MLSRPHQRLYRRSEADELVYLMVAPKLKYWIYGLALCAVGTILSYEFLDRPLSFFAHDHLHGYPVFGRLTGLTEYFPPLAILIVAVLGVVRLGDYSLGYR